MSLLHCRYGAHLSKEGVAELVVPHPNALELVHSWFAHHGVPSSSISTTHGGSWVTVASVPVLQANKLLGASYQLYRYSGTNDTPIIRTVGYGLPTVLHAHVQTVVPTTFFASPRTLQQTPQRHPVGAVRVPVKAAPRDDEEEPPNGDEEVTPDFLRYLYATTAYSPFAISRNALGIVGFDDQFPSPEDLQWFMIAFRSDGVDATFKVELVNNGRFDSSMPGFEANENMQYAQAMAYPTPHIFYSIGGKVKWSLVDGEPIADDSYLVWLTYLLNLDNIPPTITTSYGGNENSYPRSYAEFLCKMYMEIGLRGASMLYSSGNDGVGAGDCKDSLGKVQFIPKFPASCMCNVISLPVGSTQTRAQVANHLATVSQVPGSLASAARRVHAPRKGWAFLEAAFRTFFRALTTRKILIPAFPPSSGSWTP
jgi:tripeptidyl-peptidase I